MGFPLVVLDMVAKDPTVEGRRSELTILALVATVRLFLLLNRKHPKILCRFSYSIFFIFSHGSGAYYGGYGEILVSLL